MKILYVGAALSQICSFIKIKQNLEENNLCERPTTHFSREATCKQSYFSLKLLLQKMALPHNSAGLCFAHRFLHDSFIICGPAICPAFEFCNAGKVRGRFANDRAMDTSTIARQ